jgi:hypothetical protein
VAGFINTIMNIVVSYNAGNFLTSEDASQEKLCSIQLVNFILPCTFMPTGTKNFDQLKCS